MFYLLSKRKSSMKNSLHRQRRKRIWHSCIIFKNQELIPFSKYININRNRTIYMEIKTSLWLHKFNFMDFKTNQGNYKNATCHRKVLDCIYLCQAFLILSVPYLFLSLKGGGVKQGLTYHCKSLLTIQKYIMYNVSHSG